MGRYSGHGYKSTLNGLLFIDMTSLKKFGYLDGYKTGSLSWNNYFDSKPSIGIEVDVYSDDKYAMLRYKVTDDWDDEVKSFRYKVSIVETQCNYGGVRYWFLCPLRKNGQYCGKRVRKLYKRGNYFGCRKCLELAYQSQNEHKGGFFGVVNRQVRAEKILETIVVPYYKGKPTRKMRQVLKIMPSRQQVDFVINQALDELDEGI